MDFTERALNDGLNAFQAWQKAVVHGSNKDFEAAAPDFRQRIKQVITPEPNEPQRAEDSDSLVFLAAAGREMYNYQKEPYLKVFQTLSCEEMGHLITLYKGIVEKDPTQARLKKLIPELEVILNTKIDQEKQEQAE